MNLIPIRYYFALQHKSYKRTALYWNPAGIISPINSGTPIVAHGCEEYKSLYSNYLNYLTSIQRIKEL